MLYDHDDDMPPRCLQCGHPAEPPMTLEQLRADGIVHNEYHERDNDGKGSRGQEFEGYHQVRRGQGYDEDGKR